MFRKVCKKYGRETITWRIIWS